MSTVNETMSKQTVNILYSSQTCKVCMGMLYLHVLSKWPSEHSLLNDHGC